MKTIQHVRRVRRPGSVRGAYVRHVQPTRVLYAHTATMIPDGMHGIEDGYHNDGWRAGRPVVVRANIATMIPDGMHAAVFLDKRRILDDIVEGLVAKGVDPYRARVLVNRVALRRQTGSPSGLGDVVADATTWITYGNDIVERSKTGNVGAEAMKAAQNINTFLGNRGDELQATSPATVDALDGTADRLTKIASGQIKYDSVAGAFVDEFGNELSREVGAGTKAVLDAPKKIIKYVGENVVKPALDVVPWYVWIGAAVAGGAIAGKTLKLW